MQQCSVIVSIRNAKFHTDAPAGDKGFVREILLEISDCTVSAETHGSVGKFTTDENQGYSWGIVQNIGNF